MIHKFVIKMQITIKVGLNFEVGMRELCIIFIPVLTSKVGTDKAASLKARECQIDFFFAACCA